MTIYLLELGFEEIPARFIPGLIAELRSRWMDALNTAHIEYQDVEVVGTYRRIATLIHGMADESAQISHRIRGPIRSVAFTEANELTPAGAGFLRKNNVTDFVVEAEGDKHYIVSYTTIPSRPTVDILGSIATSVVSGISLPIAMKWGDGYGPFIRPVHWIVSLLGDRHVPVEFLGIRSGAMTRTHRFLGSYREATITSASDYVTILNDHYVNVLPAGRRDIIRNELDLNRIHYDVTLLEEVVFLTEWPVPIWGAIDSDHMTLPAPAVVECIQKNQKYFPAIIDGQLTDRYLIIADSVTPANEAIIKRGNHSVLRARLEDVKFFWNEDRNNSYDNWVKKLDAIVYQKGLGSVGDKVRRMMPLADRFAQWIGADRVDSVRAAQLSKGDLVSQMVQELPKLQGVMGGIYAQLSGESSAVSSAITHLYDSDIRIDQPVCAALALADRLDTVVSCFANGLIPTGSQDPWGVRRAALAVVRALHRLHIPMTLTDLVSMGFDGLGTGRDKQDLCISFMMDRARYIFETDGVGSDMIPVSAVVDSVISPHRSLVQMAHSASHLQSRISDPRLKLITETVIRVSRLGRSASGRFDPSRLDTNERAGLDPVIQWMAGTDIHTLDDFHVLTDVMPAYFESTLIMDPDLDIRSNRLSFLRDVSTKCELFADFEKLSPALGGAQN
ncbi:glycine--tRNA ligase subunit beta [bacterium]|nr:glycine--tRNA ligase subunit beta [bacterium]